MSQDNYTFIKLSGERTIFSSFNVKSLIAVKIKATVQKLKIKQFLQYLMNSLL